VRLPGFLLRPLAAWARRKLEHSQDRHDLFDRDCDLYMRRAWLVRPAWYTRGLGLRVHHVVRSDMDRALHDHPWWYATLLLEGEYDEHLPRVSPRHGPAEWVYHWPTKRFVESTLVHRRQAGEILVRGAGARHRLELYKKRDCWTLFLHGRKSRGWGFHTAHGFMPAQEYLND
jgi:hypothetical protein